MSFSLRPRLSVLTLVAAVACSVVLATSVITVFLDHQHRRKISEDFLAADSIRLTSVIDSRIQQIMTDAEAVARELESGDASDAKLPISVRTSELKRLLRECMNRDPYIDTVGVGFSPFAFDPESRLMGLECILDNGRVVFVDTDEQLDYTLEGSRAPWFGRCTSERRSLWLEPGFAPSGGSLRATYAVPFGAAGDAEEPRSPAGVLYVVVGVERFGRTLGTLSSSSGSALLVSAAGKVIHHSDRNQLGEQLPGWVAPPKEPPETDSVVDTAEGFIVDRSVPAAGWTLRATDRTNILENTPEARRRYICMVILGVAVIGFLALSLVLSHPRSTAACWGGSVGFSAALTVGICSVLMLQRWVPPEVEFPVSTESAVSRFVKEHNTRSLRLREQLPVFVPTGVYVQSLTFISSNDVRITGYVWQKYRDGVHDGISRGFVMPESEFAEIEEPQSLREGDQETLLWRFRVVLHQRFDYSRYPFSRETVWIQLWHQDFIQDVVLVPDLASYKATEPRRKPGLLKEIPVPGWNVERTYFSYREKTYDTAFGATESSGLTHFPELYFNILMSKGIGGPLISHFLPISIVTALIFTLLLLSNRDEQANRIVGFNTMNLVAVCAGFFLVLIFLHISLRDSLAAEGLIYADYFYCITYVMILLSVCNSVLFSRTNVRWIRYRDNWVAQLLFWPICLGLAFSLTVLSFL